MRTPRRVYYVMSSPKDDTKFYQQKTPLGEELAGHFTLRFLHSLRPPTPLGKEIKAKKEESFRLVLSAFWNNGDLFIHTNIHRVSEYSIFCQPRLKCSRLSSYAL